ncbi:MAG: preprotein translocase subunit SecG [Patescibacteria group bacterium]|nr:preprotein translocase subunit SecG [Patescibacteria group bacterium]
MSFIANILPYVQIILSVFLILFVLFQKSGTDAGGVFGGGSEGSTMYNTRRGFEKFLFNFTIITGILFTAFALVAILIK